MWALGDYPRVAADVIPDLGAVLVEACGVAAHHRVLDVAAGCGNAAIPAAATGGAVVTCDLTPELLAAGRDEPARRGVTVEWRETDAEALPFAEPKTSSTSCCPASASCSPRATSGAPTSSFGSAGREGPSGSSAGRRRGSWARWSSP